MRSTRSNLIVYFLALLAAGVGVIAVLADRVVVDALTAKERVADEALNLRTLERIKSEQDKFDRELLTHARLISRIARTHNPQLEADRQALLARVYFLGTGCTPLTGLSLATLQTGLPLPFVPRRPDRPGPPPTAPSQGQPQSLLSWWLLRAYSASLPLDEPYLKAIDDDDRTAEYVQFNYTYGSSSGRRSPNLIAANFVLPFNRDRSDKLLDLQEAYDDIPLPGPVNGRRVIFKTPLSRGGFQRGPSGDQSLYVQVARRSTELEHQVAAFRSEAAQEKETLQAETRLTIRWTRLTLAFTAVLTFLACLLGSSWLVRRGLTPLNRLSDAVSQVSERDFHLSVERHELTTELQPIHTRITATLDQLKLAFEREKQAVADISHELRTPVASLLATIDVSLRKPRTAEQYHQTLQECRGLTKQLGQLVEKVMALAYLDAGQAKLSRVPVDAADLATSCAAVIRPLAEAHGLQFELTATGPVEVTTDPDKLREVLTNLLHNAVEYNQAGGKVELNVAADADAVRFRVTDTGIGMTPAVRGKIFERFFRADPSRTATGVHAGLGLAIVKEYVDRLGGSISVESEPHVGSTFCVTLPAA